MGKKTICPHNLATTKCPECAAEYHRRRYEERMADPVKAAAMKAKNDEYRALRKAEKEAARVRTFPAPGPEDGACTAMELVEVHRMRKRKTGPYVQ